MTRSIELRSVVLGAAIALLTMDLCPPRAIASIAFTDEEIRLAIDRAIVRLGSDDPSVRLRGIAMIEQWPAHAVLATRALVESLDDESPEIRRRAAYLLGEISCDDERKCSAALSDLLSDANDRVASAAAYGLGLRKSDGLKIERDLVNLAERGSDEALVFATFAMKKNERRSALRATASSAAERLLDRAVETGDGRDVERMMKAFASIDRSAAARFGLGLVSDLGPDHDNVRIALRTLGETHPGAPSVFLSELSDPKGLDRANVARSLGFLGVSSGEVSSALLECATDEKDSAAPACARAIGDAGTALEEVLTALQSLMISTNAELRMAAARALMKVDSTRFDEMLPKLRAVDEDQARTLEAIRKLSRL